MHHATLSGCCPFKVGVSDFPETKTFDTLAEMVRQGIDFDMGLVRDSLQLDLKDAKRNHILVVGVQDLLLFRSKLLCVKL